MDDVPQMPLVSVVSQEQLVLTAAVAVVSVVVVSVQWVVVLELVLVWEQWVQNNEAVSWEDGLES